MKTTTMTTNNAGEQRKEFKVGQLISYTNGSHTIYTGTIKTIVPQRNNQLYFTVIDETDKASVELWNAGYAVGSFICETQIKEGGSNE